MYVCLCKGVSDRHIRRAVQEGSVTRMRDLRRELGVCTDCGKCGQCAKGVLKDALAEMGEVQAIALQPALA
ncbi:MAG: (2Fe-2S)-binding protein [Candidatus Competibacteraceae bacterium]|nr:(2Fe-2S)-binding protein [Candidatus Competibacteraceae bacterium]